MGNVGFSYSEGKPMPATNKDRLAKRMRWAARIVVLGVIALSLFGIFETTIELTEIEGFKVIVFYLQDFIGLVCNNWAGWLYYILVESNSCWCTANPNWGCTGSDCPLTRFGPNTLSPTRIACNYGFVIWFTIPRCWCAIPFYLGGFQEKRPESYKRLVCYVRLH